VVVPPGSHVVYFTFAPLSLRVGAGASMAGLLVVAGLLVARPRPVTAIDAGSRA
jgi:hypothetical protein